MVLLIALSNDRANKLKITGPCNNLISKVLIFNKKNNFLFPPPLYRSSIDDEQERRNRKIARIRNCFMYLSRSLDIYSFRYRYFYFYAKMVNNIVINNIINEMDIVDRVFGYIIGDEKSYPDQNIFNLLPMYKDKYIYIPKNQIIVGKLKQYNMIDENKYKLALDIANHFDSNKIGKCVLSYLKTINLINDDVNYGLDIIPYGFYFI
jgi:hypothetical protein